MSTPNTISRRSFLRRSAAAMVSLASAGVAYPTIRSAMAQNGDYQLVCTSDDVRVREQPGLSAAIIGQVNTGDVVSVTGETRSADGYDWLPVFAHNSGINGFVASDFFERPDGGSGWVRGTPVHVTSDGVNLRSGPGIGNQVIGNFNVGTSGIVNDGPSSGSGYSWYNVTLDGVTGWMAADFLAEGSSGEPGPGNGQFRIGAYVRPTSDLNLRSGPDTGNGVIGVYSPDTIATILDGPSSGGGYAWYQVELWDNAGTVGWFAGEFLEAARFEPTGARHQVTDGPLNLRTGSGLAYPIATSLPTGSVFVIKDASIASADGYNWMWVYVENDPSLEGWVAMGFSEEI